MSTTDKFLIEEKTRAELLLQVREGDRYEMLFAANYDASVQKRPFLLVLTEQVEFYTRDYQGWAQEQMNRSEAQAEESRVAAGYAQYHEADL